MRTLSDSRAGMMSEINITPFVDIMMLLLIIFMVTAPLLQQGLPVNLPQAQSPALKRTQKDIIVTIQKNDTVYIGNSKKSLSMKEFAVKLKTIFENKQKKDLFIKADSDLKYGTVVQVMSVAKKAGATRIGMITQPETSL